MKSILTGLPWLGALLLLLATGCDRSGLALSPQAASFGASARVRPNTLHVIPLHDFSYGENVVGPGGSGALIGDSSTALYGVVPAGGDKTCHTKDHYKGCGYVYELTPQSSGSTYNERVLYTFEGADGAEPIAALLMDATGNLYGTTALGGKHGKGTIFEMTPSGSGYTESVLHSFDGTDGSSPYTSLIEVSGTLYGTTGYGGPYKGSGCSGGCGVAFSQGASGYKVLHYFGGTSSGSDGAVPYANLTDVNGTLYGTTDFGGSAGQGTVFEMSLSGQEQVLYSFKGGSDGAYPLGSGVVDVNGVLYGTTYGGGTKMCQCGIIYSLTTAGKETPLHRFSGACPDGEDPMASLRTVDGTLYGTTFKSGARSGCGCGVVFSIAPGSSGSSFQLQTVFAGGKKGGHPAAPLLAGESGSFFGTTSTGGHGYGVAFELAPGSGNTTKK
ncbi:MAG: choice-of-anchor tandem repeat GloVer-containing protein [Candidatus Baltobacteraceae bacterium]